MGQKQAKLRQEVVDELVKQTAFSESEIQDWYKGFIKDCPTGHLTVDEFKQIYTKFFPYGEATRFAEYVFKTFDRNRDGMIDFREFLSTVSITSRGSLDQKLRWAFSMYDLDGDGYISRQDLYEVISSIYTLIGSTIELPVDETTPERRSDKIFLQMDTDHDDRLSFEEFSSGIKADKTLVRVLYANTAQPPQSSPALLTKTASKEASDRTAFPTTVSSKDLPNYQDEVLEKTITRQASSNINTLVSP